LAILPARGTISRNVQAFHIWRELAGNEEGTGSDGTKNHATSESSVESACLPLPEFSFMVSIPLMPLSTPYIDKDNGSNSRFLPRVWHQIITSFFHYNDPASSAKY